MKKFFSLVTALIMAISLVGILPSVAASALTSGDYEYTVLEDGTVEITGYTGSETDIEIPDEIEGKAVTSIGDSAFAYCRLTSVTIPNSVTSIGDRAFEYCSRLTSITIPNSVMSIGDSAFYECESLTEINVDTNNKNYTSQEGILFNKSTTELIKYPSGKTQASYTIPNSVINIVDSAFSHCSSLTNITIPSSITSIGEYVFWNCDILENITIPDSITSIGKYAFWDCDGLENITIPDSVTSIGSNAFLECDNLTSITIPDSVTSIGSCAFMSCINLKSAVIGNGVKVIKDNVFTKCSSLTSVIIGNSVIDIGEYAFYDCINLKSFTIPKNVKSIAGFALGYYFLSSDDHERLTKVSGFKIYCYKGTAGEQYAIDFEMDYELLSDVTVNINEKPVLNPATNTNNKKITSVKPAKVKSVKLTAKKKKLIVKWKKVSGATGYEVMYAKNNKFKGKKTVKVKKNKVTLKRLKSKKKYFVKVRAYKTVNGNTNYGKWSKIVKKKTK